jgi:CheY-like chemotaxis protein
MKILVVEDNSRQQEVAKQQLAEHDVTVTASYREAFKMMEDARFDVLLTDLHLPASTEYPLDISFTGQEVQAGWVVVLKGISVAIPMIGLLTDADHHQDTASALVDLIHWKVLTMGTSKVLFDNGTFINRQKKDGLEYGDKLWAGLLEEIVEQKLFVK